MKSTLKDIHEESNKKIKELEKASDIQLGELKFNLWIPISQFHNFTIFFWTI